MFIRVKSKSSRKDPGGFRKSVQIVENLRIKGKVRQRIVKHVGVAHSPEQLEDLKVLATSVQIQLGTSKNSYFLPDTLAVANASAHFMG